MCKKIHRGGNAEQYHADKKYKEAVAEAVEACADLSEAVTTLESVAMSYKRVLGQAHPETPKVQSALQKARKKLAWAHASRDATDSYTRSLGSVLLAKGMTSLELSELKDSVGL